jgi:hypothetical protein
MWRMLLLVFGLLEHEVPPLLWNSESLGYTIPEGESG